jgi:hypothetical protein
MAAGGGGVNRVTGLACAATCTGMNKNVVCTKDADCPQSAPTCGTSILLSGFGICR